MGEREERVPTRTHVPLQYLPPARPAISTLTRPQLAARIHVLRGVLDELWTQSQADGAQPFFCIGAAKVELVSLEAALREHNRRPS